MLSDLVAAGITPVLTFTQPDRPQGRGRQLASCPVARLGESLALPVLRTPDINSAEVAEALTASGVEVLVVAAFGQLLGPELLASVDCINVHASLLPKYRGAAPIYWALRNGDSETGVCVMRIVRALDAGPVAALTRLSIGPRDDAGSLGRSLALLGALSVRQVLEGMADGTVEWREQDGEWTYAAKVGPAERVLHPEGASALDCHNLVRALSPEVGADLGVEGLRLKVWRSWPRTGDDQNLPAEARALAGRPALWAALKDRLFLGCSQGVLEIFSLQAAGKQAVSAAEFVRGYGRRLPTLSAQPPSSEPSSP